MTRIPRKKKKQIPKNTYYCYDSKTMISCPFHICGDGIFGYCSLIYCKIEDQIKSCGISIA